MLKIVVLAMFLWVFFTIFALKEVVILSQINAHQIMQVSLSTILGALLPIVEGIFFVPSFSFVKRFLYAAFFFTICGFALRAYLRNKMFRYIVIAEIIWFFSSTFYIAFVST